MSILITARRWDITPWVERFRRLGPDRVVHDGREPFDPAAIRYAAVWRPEPGLLASLPNLKAIFNLGAGVDALLQDKTLPDVPIIRIINPDLTQRMSEWVILQVLYHFRQLPAHRAAQMARHWLSIDQPAASSVRVGIMGMGVLGQDAAEMLIRLGFQVAGWSRTPKAMTGLRSFSGAAELPAFLAQTDILVVLLPLTPETDGILNRDLFAQLARGGALGAPVLINAGRGGLQREADILVALDDGTLGGASLDVFEVEPLPEESPLWAHPKVVVTPHCAADSTPDGLVAGILADIAAFERGEKLVNLVDRRAGY
ncbi:MAG: glyoxylate/hydroxypyruvate reductase A [Proteobacteria bacterium]|nr:glyoxylate/hydroxypyruvate reductase A [Pseudomonadota bacterium]